MRRRLIVAAVSGVASVALLSQGWSLYWSCLGYFAGSGPLVCVDYPSRTQGIAFLFAGAVAAGIAVDLVYRRPRIPFRSFRTASVLGGVLLLVIGGILATASVVQGEATIREHNASCIGLPGSSQVYQRCIDLTAAQRTLRGWALIGAILAGLGGAFALSGIASAFLPSSPGLGIPVVASGILFSLQAWEDTVSFSFCSPWIVYGGSDQCPGAFGFIGPFPLVPILLGLFAGVLLGVGVALVVLREDAMRVGTTTHSA